MSKPLSNAFVQQFTAEVKHAYQASGKLRDTVRVVDDVTGNTYNFQKMGKGLASQRTPQAEVSPMNVSHSQPSATLKDWIAAEYTDIFDDEKTKISERQALAQTIGKALSRRLDQVIIDTIDGFSASGSQQIAETFGGTDAFSTEKIRNGANHFDDLEIPMEDRHIIATVTAKEQLLGTTAPTSSDFASIKALVNGEIDTWMGFNFHWIGSRNEGGLTVSSDIASNWMYHKSAVGLAIGIDMDVDVDWVPNRTSWLSQGRLSAGGANIDTDGLVEVKSDETVTVNQGTDA